MRSILYSSAGKSFPSFPFILAALLSVAPVLLPAQWTREEAADILLDPANGVVIPPQAVVWSPFADFGGGTGFEGLLPSGTTVDPATPGGLPYPGPGLTTSGSFYFFWIDLFPFSDYQHHTLFVLLDANDPDPTVANGGIIVSDQGWWPVVKISGQPDQSFFDDDILRASNDPPAYLNPDGLIFGDVQRKDDIISLPTPTLRTSASEGSPRGPNACGLVVTGYDQNTHVNNAIRYTNDLKNHYGVPAGRIVQAKTDGMGRPAAAKIADLDAAIMSICNQNPACDKIYVRITSHGSNGSIALDNGNETLSAQQLCQKIQKIAGKGVPVCLIINACFSGTLLDNNNWNLPAGSSIITSAKDTTSYGGGDTYREEGSGDVFTESAFAYAFSKCLNDNTDTDGDGKKDADKNGDGIVDDCEAYDWVIAKRPCYRYRLSNGMWSNSMVYPNGPQTWWDPMPQKRTVGIRPYGINVNVQNLTGAPKTDFHLILKGNVTGGTARAWRSNENDQIGAPWAGGTGQTTVTYNEERDETMVCWIDNDNPVANGDFIHFGYIRLGGGLRPVRQYWTPTPEPPAAADRVPTATFSLTPSDLCAREFITISVRDESNGGWAVESFFDVFVRIAPAPIPLENLNLSDPLVAGLPQITLGTFSATPEGLTEIPLDLGSLPLTPESVIILEARAYWDFNPNTAYSLMELPLPDPFPADADGDGICDAEDICDGGDDKLNADADFYPDACDCDPIDPNDSNQTIGAPGEPIPPGLYQANVSIESRGLVLPEGDVVFQAGKKIILKPGFHVLAGSFFHGKIQACEPITTTIAGDEATETREQPLSFPAADPLPGEYGLDIAPNPFNGRTMIRYVLPEPGPVQLVVFSLAGGRPVWQRSAHYREEGTYTVTFSGESLPAGIYQVLLRTEKQMLSRKIILLH